MLSRRRYQHIVTRTIPSTEVHPARGSDGDDEKIRDKREEREKSKKLIWPN